eukprot:CAMPEP_0174844106 /NCGR_PEP_ID=MMETSP1114-20130205/10907_1 /TAXON_ID=312471 /ORGANISM="Neobodo designis, Strain CCAP 1951/1" /LENGTH=515 /DNA_ID=CAMNT_0016078339 /DNA_START=55 /DNA_END=1599 /DNA_ORIENTATION=+
MAVAHANARQQRLQTLRSDLALKEQELREVRARLADLESTKPAATVDFLTQACKSRKVLDQVPLAQIGNTTALFRTATTEELEKQKLLKRTMAEIELQLKHALAAKARARKEFDRIVEKTGYTTSKLAPSSKLPADEPELDEFEMRQTIAQMKKNIHAATTLNRTKSNTLGALSTELERRREKQLVVEEELNAVLVVQRQINERKERLHELLTRHARLDARITAAQDAVDQETAALLQLDVAAYKQRSAEVVEARRAEDRVLKAQEARIAQLDDRLKMVRTVLDAHGLLGPVEAVVHELCNAADQRRLDGPSKHVDPAATDAEAPPTDAAATEEPNTLDAIVAKYSDIETLAPEYELLPASILSVFQHDLQQHERNLRVKSVMVQEKEDTKLALIAKVKDLQVQHEETVDRVHDLKENNELSIDAHVDSARDVLAAKKAAFDDLLRQNARLSHQIRALQSSAPSRSPSQAPQDTETGDKSSPQRSSSKADDEAAKKPRSKKAKESPGGTKSEDPV